MFTLTTMKAYTTSSKALILSLLLAFSLTGCAWFSAPKYDTNELLLMAQFKNEVAELPGQCDALTNANQSINLQGTKKSFRLLQFYTKQTPHNEDYVKMLKTVDILVTDLDKRNGQMSKVYCTLKVKNIETAINIISQSSGKKF